MKSCQNRQNLVAPSPDSCRQRQKHRWLCKDAINTRHTLVSSSLLTNEHQEESESLQPSEDAAAISSSLPSHLCSCLSLYLRLHAAVPAPAFKTLHPVRFHSTPFSGLPSSFPPCSHSGSNPKHLFPPSIFLHFSLPPSLYSPFCLYSRPVSYVTHDDSAAPPFGCCSFDSPLQRCQNCVPALRSRADVAVTCVRRGLHAAAGCVRVGGATLSHWAECGQHAKHSRYAALAMQACNNAASKL